MQPCEPIEIAIIGGGLVGASLALALQDGAKARGWRLRLIEPFLPGEAYQPSYDARSSALSYGTRQLYEGLGVWPTIAKRAEPIRQIHVSERGCFGATWLDAREEGVAALGYVVDNAWIGHCLWQALDETVVIDCPASVQQMQATTAGYRLTLNDGRQLDCALAVLADGGRSPLREQLGVSVHSKSYGQTAIIANLTPSRPHQNIAYERFTESGPMALLPLPENRCALVWSCPEEVINHLMNLPAARFLSELQQRFGYRLGAFSQLGERHAYPLALVRAAEQVRSGLVLLGNVAHSLHPIAGQGYNLSLRDAMTLAEVLLHSSATPGTLADLQRYQAQQGFDQRLTIGFSDRLVELFGEGRSVLRHSRSLGLLALDMLPAARQQFTRRAMGLGARA